MTKRYLVDLRSLTPEQRERAFLQMEQVAFLATRVLGPSGLEQVTVAWDLEEDFPTSALVPSGCPCREI